MKKNVLLIIIILLGFFLRFYKLGDIPNGLYQDETAIGWNAYSILNTGRDEYAKPYPLYFKSFGDYKLPVYIYLTVPSVYFFGLTPFAVRLPSAMFGVLTLPFFYLLVKKITKKENLALLSTLFLSVNPWHLHYSRATFEVSIVLFLFTVGILLFHIGMQKKKIAFLGSILCFILALYTYNLTRLLSPMIFAGLLLLYKKNIKNISVSEKIVSVIFGGILLVPFISTYFQNGGISSASGTLIFSSAAVRAPLLEFRSYLISLPIINKLVFNSISLILWQYVANITTYLSVPFFFLTGSMHGNHGIGTDGQLYLFELPFVLYGIYTFLKTKHDELLPFFLTGIATILTASLTREAPHATRSFPLLLLLPVLSAYGCLMLLIRLKKEQKNFQYVIYGLLILVGIFSVSHYFSSYYLRFPTAYAKQWREEDKYVAEFIQHSSPSYEHIIIDSDAGLIYSSLLFYLQYSPSTFQQTVKRAPDDNEGMSDVISFGNIIYKKVDPADYKVKNALIITTKEKIPEYRTPIKIFSYPSRPVVIALKQEILQYPTQETAYVAISSSN